MSPKVVSVLIFPYANQLEVRVSRGSGYNRPIDKINIYHAKYSEHSKVKRLAKLASKLTELNVLKMIESSAYIYNPIR